MPRAPHLPLMCLAAHAATAPTPRQAPPRQAAFGPLTRAISPRFGPLTGAIHGNGFQTVNVQLSLWEDGARIAQLELMAAVGVAILTLDKMAGQAHCLLFGIKQVVSWEWIALERQQLRSPGVLFSRVNQTETARCSLERLQAPLDLLALGAVYYRPPRSRRFGRLGSTLLPLDSPDRLQAQEVLLQEAGELRIHTQPKRYGVQPIISEQLHFCGDYVVVDKPCEWLIPLVAAAAAARLKRERDQLLACQRLDVSTSGLVVLARTKAAADHFQQLLRGGRVRKIYRAQIPGKIALLPEHLDNWISDSVFGVPAPRLIAPLGADVEHGTHKWRRAQTSVLSQQPSQKEKLELRLKLHSGRTHQLRAQLSSHGAVIDEDRLYAPLAGFQWLSPADDPEAAERVAQGKAAGNLDAIALQCCEADLEWSELTRKAQMRVAFQQTALVLPVHWGTNSEALQLLKQFRSGRPTFFSQSNWMAQRQLREFEDDPTIAARLAKKKQHEKKKQEEDSSKFRWLSSWFTRSSEASEEAKAHADDAHRHGW
ncbi:unnamed protein product [Effrenium voratum]|nr:unnamed protein product [Effrenium voratum]